MQDLRCMSFTSKGSAEIIVAGLQDTMLVIDLIKGEVVKQVRAPPDRDSKSPLTRPSRYLRNTSTQ
jgi:hypothetical protein